MTGSNEKVAVKETKEKKVREPRDQVKAIDRIKSNLTNDVLRGKVAVNDLAMLEEYLKKLKAVLS